MISKRASTAPVRLESLHHRFGVCQWFHYEDRRTVERSITLLRELGVKHLRTGISWADFFRPGGKRWYDWQMRTLASAGLELLLSVWHTPPSISEGLVCNSPPKRLRDYADFIDLVITEYGGLFTHLELWNEPNNRYKWDFETFDPHWRKFAEMVGGAAYWAKQRGCNTVLGGMIPVDHHWLNLMHKHGVLEHVDIIAIHGFPGMWWPNHPNWEWHDSWAGWDAKITYIAQHAQGKPIWITETGLATWDLATSLPAKFDLQRRMLNVASRADAANRVYWYSLIDLDPSREAIEGFHVDENEYHMGLVQADGTKKPAFQTLKNSLSRPRVRTLPITR